MPVSDAGSRASCWRRRCMAPVGKSELMQQLRDRAAADRPAPLRRAAGRRAGLGPRGIRALSPRASPRAAGPFVATGREQPARGRCETQLFGREEAGRRSTPACSSRLRAAGLCSSTSSRICRRARSDCWSACSRPGSSRAWAARSRCSLHARVIVFGVSPASTTARSTRAFRRELLARLNTLIVRVPPLREYAEDVPELLRYYVDRAGRRRRVCRSAASASPHRTGCATIRGRTTCAS